MRLFRIKNKDMYIGKDNPNGHHTYAVYKDWKTGKYRAIQLTHIYDPKKEKLIKKGYLKIEHFNQFIFPTGVHNTYYETDVNGKDLNFGRKTVYECVGRVPSGQAKRIKNFAKKKHK